MTEAVIRSEHSLLIQDLAVERGVVDQLLDVGYIDGKVIERGGVGHRRRGQRHAGAGIPQRRVALRGRHERPQTATAMLEHVTAVH